jgi:spermidine synthase
LHSKPHGCDSGNEGGKIGSAFRQEFYKNPVTDRNSPTHSPAESDPARLGNLFLVSLLILFLELACIRWFPAHVLFLTFFTNTVLLACFVGMSVGCLAASRPARFILWTPPLLAVAMGAAHLVEHLRTSVEKVVSVGNPQSPQLVFFGTEYVTPDPASFYIPVEVLDGFFFLIIALALVGPGQELGRAFQQVPSRIRAYSVNVGGSLAGIVLFALCSKLELAPVWWFAPAALTVAWFIWLGTAHRSWLALAAWRGATAACLAVVVWLALRTGGNFQISPQSYGSYLPEAVTRNLGRDFGTHLWSPYYRIDFDRLHRSINVNLIAHQDMVSRRNDRLPSHAYQLPHLLRRDAGGAPFANVLIIGAGSGNDVSRALAWGARHVDAVEIDPVILRLGRQYHWDAPYADPRVTTVVDDGRNFLRSTGKQYDLIIYALVDSLVLHSSYSNIRLESFLFTEQAFEDVRRRLKPGGQFVVYNYFRQGWIVGRIFASLKKVFGNEPLVITLPARPSIEPESGGGFTIFIAGDNQKLRDAFQAKTEYWLYDLKAASPESPNGFEMRPAASEQTRWKRFIPAAVHPPANLRLASDDWPFLYLRQPMLPALSLRGMTVMGAMAFLLIFLFIPRQSGLPGTTRFSWRMFFLGAGFMLVETKAVVHMALLFGSTWMVNSVVFFAVLVMILLSNLFVLRFRPGRLRFYYAGLLAALAANVLVPLDYFLGMSCWTQVVASCLLVFAPIFFAGVVFAVSFRDSQTPDRDFGANTAGAMAGGLAENASMLLGFRYLLLLAVAFYLLSAIFRISVAATPTPAE